MRVRAPNHPAGNDPATLSTIVLSMISAVVPLIWMPALQLARLAESVDLFSISVP
jgi:hypothetical protein